MIITLMIKVIRSYEMQLLIRTTHRVIQEGDILPCHSSEKPKFYICKMFLFFYCKNHHHKYNNTEEWCLLGCYAVWLL
jgi:hypothetical protein